ncbi:MAG TPA: thioesterase family protein [Isosphaeraceae bacterium]|nr:thioesterase family protein [Isosphaeraceae bacterium]
MNLNLAPGLKGEARRVVGEADTARSVGSGGAPVLATPMMIALMEAAAVSAVDHLLPAGHQTVGVRVDVRHTAATPLGMEVIAQAELIAVNGRALTFRVTASDAKEPIGEGTHERAVIELERFLARVKAKSGGV